ncbi:MAG: PAS domain-containing protein [Loktanella sp.]|nr:PAS domain-containing protein [Loktanella sp.]
MITDETAAEMIGSQVADVSLATLRESPDCIKLLNPQGRISFISENGLCALDITRAEDIAGRTWWELWPDDQRDALKRAFEMSLEGKVTMYQGHCPTAAGIPKDWDIRITPIMDETGAVSSVLAISREVPPIG